ncbi:biotin/lipoyl attachment domain-containing protein [Flavobacteria bacterium MS024-3C]|nr:biotin/lipoyl attachment domain-containing protein [Flavobacteria bacterium MS024-3C]
MILEMKVPSPGESITEVEIAAWLVQDGDYVEKDQAIAEVDSDKATLELPAEMSGVITLKAEEGDAVAVGAVVCLIDTSAVRPEGDAPAKVAKATPEAAPAVASAPVKETPLLLLAMRQDPLLRLLRKYWQKKACWHLRL